MVEGMRGKTEAQVDRGMAGFNLLDTQVASVGAKKAAKEPQGLKIGNSRRGHGKAMRWASRKSEDHLR